MNSKGSRAIFGLLVGVAVLIVVVVVGLRAIGGLLEGGNASFSKPQNAVEIKVVYAPELDLYMRDVITDFNRSYAQGRNPVTGKELARGEKPIWVTGGPGSSGTVAQGIINAVIAPNNANVERPTLFAPSVRHWLALVNYQTGQSVFDVNGAPATAVAPVVMAIWESRLEAIKSRNPGKEIGWQELFQVINSPNGWRDYGLSGRQAVYYGHTDPFVSSTALSTLMAEFYASARYNAGNVSASKLTQDQANDPKVLEGVRQFERLIKHYSARTTEFKEYIAQGPEYLDFVALEENDLIFINQGKTQARPTEKLVALYPKEGTFVHDHPFAVPNANWVTDEQRAAAKVFTEFNLTKDVQLKVLENGFRPANPQVPIGFPITAENGVDPSQPRTLLPVPDPAVLATVQNSWQLVKKQASVVLLVDTSGSMGESDKIGQARGAAKVFLDDQGGKNNISLVEFNTTVRTLVPMASLEQNRGDLNTRIDGLRANGNTALYDALLASIDQLQKNSDSNRIQAIVLLSDGQDTSSKATVNDVVRAIQVARNGKAPILVIPVAYGKDADINALNAIARASDTKVQAGDANTIKRLLEVIGSYF